MNKKLIAIDLDGTLLDSSLGLSSFTISTLKKIKEQGHIIVLASGRPYRSMKDFYYTLGLDSPIISYNGAYVFNPSSPSFPKLERKFSKESLRKIYKDNKGILISSMAEDGEKIYLSKEEPYLNNYFPYVNEKYFIGDMEKIIDEDCYTSLFNCLDKDVPQLEKSLKDEGIILRHWNGNTYSEGSLPNVNKGSALAYILSVLNIDPKDCIAFGDSDNDYEMLSIVSKGYVLSNSKSSLLLNTFEKTEKDNDHDGVANTLNSLLLLPKYTSSKD